MARTKKSEINTLENILNNIRQKTKTIKWNDISIDVKNFMSIKDISTFVASATNICFTSSEDYMPEIFEFAIGISTLITYTNFTLPESIDDQYNLILFTDIIPKVIECIDAVDQYSDAIESVKEKIDYRIDSNINLIKNQTNELVASMDNMIYKIKDIFGNIESEDVKGMVKALSGGKFDEEKMMKAYLENKK